MSNKLAIASDAPLDVVLSQLQRSKNIRAEVLASDNGVFWLRTPQGQRITADYSPKNAADEMETFIAVDEGEAILQREIFRALRELPYESRWYDEDDEEAVYRPESALPAQPWTPP